MTPARLDARVVADRLAWIDDEICARQLGDVVSCAEALRVWIAAHPDRVDQAL